MAPSVCVFTCGNGTYYALSVQADGANLPALAECNQQWSLVKVVSMTERGLQPFVPNARTAIANLTALGYHLARVSADTPQLSQAHRRSA